MCLKFDIDIIIDIENGVGNGEIHETKALLNTTQVYSKYPKIWKDNP